MPKNEKRGEVTAFDGIRGTETAERIKNWNKNQPSGQWRKLEQVKVNYTYIVQTWTHLDKEYTRKHISPYGMKTFVTKLLEQRRNTNKRSIPNDVREALELGADSDFDQNDIKLTCSDEGDEGMGTFYLLFCSKCQEVKPSLLVKRFPSILPTLPSIKDIQDSWDQMIAEDPSIKKEVDICAWWPLSLKILEHP